MTTGLASGIANSILNALCRNTAWTQPAAFYVKLHTGDPGSAGTANASATTTRQSVTWQVASGGTTNTANDLAWTNMTATETISHLSFWSASSSGTFLGSDALDIPRSVQAGDNFTIIANEGTLTLSPVAA